MEKNSSTKQARNLICQRKGILMQYRHYTLACAKCAEKRLKTVTCEDLRCGCDLPLVELTYKIQIYG